MCAVRPLESCKGIVAVRAVSQDVQELWGPHARVWYNSTMDYRQVVIVPKP